MRAGQFEIGDVMCLSSKLWGGGEYPCIVLDRLNLFLQIQHPNGQRYTVEHNERCCRGTEEEFLKLERGFDAKKSMTKKTEEALDCMDMFTEAYTMTSLSAKSITKSMNLANLPVMKRKHDA